MTNPAAPEKIFELQKQHQQRVRGRSAAERIGALRKLKREIFARRAELEKALWADLRKSPAEAGLNELFPVAGEIKHAEKNLHNGCSRSG